MAYVKVLVFRGTQIWHIPMCSVARINQFQIRSLNFITKDVSDVGFLLKCLNVVSVNVGFLKRSLETQEMRC